MSGGNTATRLMLMLMLLPVAVCAWRVSPPLHPSFSVWTASLPCQTFRGRLHIANNSAAENVNQAPERIFQTGCELSLGRQLWKWEELHDNLTSGTQTQLCFLISHRQQSPLLHLYFTPKLLFLVGKPPLSSLLTRQMVDIIPTEAVRPIQLILYILLLKCSLLNVTEPNISTKLPAPPQT